MSNTPKKLQVGDKGTFHPGNGHPPARATIVHVWSDTCVNLETDEGFKPTSVLIHSGEGEGAPSGFYFVPDAPAEAPKVKTVDLTAEIASEHYFNLGEGRPGFPELGLITVCVLVLKNGYRLVGVNEGPVSAESFDAELGRSLAYDKAIEQVWPLLGFRLRDKLAAGA